MPGDIETSNQELGQAVSADCNCLEKRKVESFSIQAEAFLLMLLNGTRQSQRYTYVASLFRK